MENPDNDNAVHGKLLEVSRVQSAETGGNTEYARDKQINHGELPTAGVFGLKSSKVYNEKNANKSRRTDTYIDTTDIHELDGREHDGLEALGGDTLKVQTKVVDITGATAAASLETGYLIVSSEVKAEDRFHGTRTTKEVTAWNPRVSTTKADQAADGEDTTTTEQVVAAGDAWPSRSLNTLELSRKQIGQDKFRQTNKVAASRPTLVSYEEEGTTGMKVSVTRTITATDPGLNTLGTARQVKTVKHATKDRWITTVREIHADILTTTFQEWHPVEFAFPSYLDADVPFRILTIQDNNAIINTLKSSPQRLKVSCLFEFKYFVAVPTILNVFQFKPIEISLRTADGSINEQNVLTDGATIAVKVTPNLEALGQQLANNAIDWSTYMARVNGYEVDFEFPPSSPTTTEYLAMMGNVQLIAHDVTKWKYNLYREVKVWMRLPDLATNLTGSLVY